MIFIGSEEGAGTVSLAVDGSTIVDVQQPNDFESAEIIAPLHPAVTATEESLIERVTFCEPACGNSIQIGYVDIEAPDE